MPSKAEQIRSMVAEHIDLPTKTLYERAQEIDPEFNLTLRQFHARFPLQVKRARTKRATPKPPREDGRTSSGKKGKKATASRASVRGRSRGDASPAPKEGQARVRSILQDLLVEFSAAEGRAGLTRFMANDLDRYVERILKA